MESLPHRHLTTLTLDVDFARITAVGTTPAGFRGIAPVSGGRFAGERVTGRVLPGHDWFVTRADGALAIDVRLTLETDDGALPPGRGAGGGRLSPRHHREARMR